MFYNYVRREKMSCFDILRQGFFMLALFVFPRLIFSNVINKCANFASEDYSLNYVVVPASLMSNFEETNFSLQESGIPFPSFCDVNYEVIKISLIGLDTISINLSTAPPPTKPLQDIQTSTTTTEEVDDSLNQNLRTTPAASQVYGTFPMSRNSGYQESFMYSVENITAIFDTAEEEQEQKCERKLSRKEVHFTPDGILFYSEEYFLPAEFCVQSINEVENWISIRKCNVDCSNKESPCIPLCCHLHEYIDLTVPCCQATLRSKPMFQPMIYDEVNRKLSLGEEKVKQTMESNTTKNRSKFVNDAVFAATVRPHYVTFKYHNACPDGLDPQHLFFNENGESTLNTRIHIQNNGKVAYVGDDRKWHFLEKFCVAGLVNVESFKDVTEGIEAMTSAIKYCLDEPVSPNTLLWPNYLLIGVFSFSSIFLLFTVIVYILLWEKQNIHGWTVMSFVASEFFLFIFLSLAYSLSLFITADEASRTPYCIGSGILAHFFFLSTFSWLTVINFDLWWTFKCLTPLSERSRGGKRFCLYMAFAWGIPITVVSTGLILQSAYKSNTSNVVVPDYGHRLCFLAHQAKGVYLYYIIGTLLMINLILISLTFLTIYKFKRSTRVASASSSKSTEKSFKLFIKLVVVMGVTWIFEVVLWFDTNGEGFSWIFLIVDLLNVLQAVATFIIFVCKRKIINQVEQRHPALKVITRPLLKLIGERSSALMASTSSKPTRSTTARSSSVLQGSRNKSMKNSAGPSATSPNGPVADSKL